MNKGWGMEVQSGWESLVKHCNDFRKEMAVISFPTGRGGSYRKEERLKGTICLKLSPTLLYQVD